MVCPGCGSSNHRDCCGAGILEGEICLFPNMSWIHENIGSNLEYELAHHRKDMTLKEYSEKLELRLMVGRHDLRRRGFD